VRHPKDKARVENQVWIETAAGALAANWSRDVAWPLGARCGLKPFGSHGASSGKTSPGPSGPGVD